MILYYILHCTYNIVTILGTEDDTRGVETCLQKNKVLRMSYGQLLHSIPEGLRRAFRKYESISRKLLNIKWSTEFNSICIKEDILLYFHICHIK